jgi:hypothetical protein
MALINRSNVCVDHSSRSGIGAALRLLPAVFGCRQELPFPL